MNLMNESEQLQTLLTTSIPSVNLMALQAASESAKQVSGGSFLVYLDRLANMVVSFVPVPYAPAAVAMLKGVESIYSMFHAPATPKPRTR